MRNTTKSSSGTSFFGSEVKTTVKQLKQILGEPDFDGNYGDDKVNFEWVMETDNGDVFTVYDWKKYRSIGELEQIYFHIGGNSKSITEQAKEEIENAMLTE